MKTSIVEKHGNILKIVLFLYLLENSSCSILASASEIPEHRVGEKVNDWLLLEKVVELASSLIFMCFNIFDNCNIFQLH